MSQEAFEAWIIDPYIQGMIQDHPQTFQHMWFQAPVWMWDEAERQAPNAIISPKSWMEVMRIGEEAWALLSVVMSASEQAIHDHMVHMLHWMFYRVDLSTLNEQGFSPVHVALMHPKASLFLQGLMDLADFQKPDRRGITPMVWFELNQAADELKRTLRMGSLFSAHVSIDDEERSDIKNRLGQGLFKSLRKEHSALSTSGKKYGCKITSKDVVLV